MPDDNYTLDFEDYLAKNTGQLIALLVCLSNNSNSKLLSTEIIDDCLFLAQYLSN